MVPVKNVSPEETNMETKQWCVQMAPDFRDGWDTKHDYCSSYGRHSAILFAAMVIDSDADSERTGGGWAAASRNSC
jgi:hypothetical protein